MTEHKAKTISNSPSPYKVYDEAYNKGRADSVKEYKNRVVELLCVEDDDYDKPVISPKFLKDYLEHIMMDY